MAELDLTLITGTSIATPATGVLAVYGDTDKRLKSKDDAATIRIFVDRDSAETLTTKTIASVATIPYIADATGAGAKKMQAGSGVLVTGTLVVATGLATVTGFTTTLKTQPTGTGTASSQILVVTAITTGAVTVSAFSVSSVTGATVAATTSTGTFSWIAFGT